MNLNHSVPMQIPFKFGQDPKIDLDSFLPNKNEPILDLLNAIASKDKRHHLYLWGGAATGKTHLLQAVCKRANDYGHQVAYIPLDKRAEINTNILDDLGLFDIVCIDDIDAIGHDLQWQQGLTWLYNELRDNHHSMLMSSKVLPQDSPLQLADLKSRLAWDQIYQIQPPDDALKIMILKQKAQARSFELSDDVVDYLMRRVDRDLNSLVKIIEGIEQASFAAKRKITIPFLRQVLEPAQK